MTPAHMDSAYTAGGNLRPHGNVSPNCMILQPFVSDDGGLDLPGKRALCHLCRCALCGQRARFGGEEPIPTVQPAPKRFRSTCLLRRLHKSPAEPRVHLNMDEVLFKSADDRKAEGEHALEKEARDVERAFCGFRACRPAGLAGCDPTLHCRSLGKSQSIGEIDVCSARMASTP